MILAALFQACGACRRRDRPGTYLPERDFSGSITIRSERTEYDRDSPATFAIPPMGTDALGRDYLTRVLYGGRISLAVGVMVVIITLTIG